MTKPSLPVSFITACVVATLSACAAVDTKTIVSNSDAYLAGHFTPAQLSAPVRSQVEKGEPLPKLFDRIDYRTVADVDEEGKVSQVTSASTYTDLGNGYIQNRTEYSRNGVPYRINLALTFAGLYRLKTQTTFVDRPNALQPIDTKDMSRFDRALGRPQAGQSYTIETKTGLAPQIMNFADEKQVCVAGASVPATSLHASLSGAAVPIDCTVTGANDVVVGKSKWMWVADLGVAFQTEHASARSTSRYRLDAVTVRK